MGLSGFMGIEGIAGLRSRVRQVEVVPQMGIAPVVTMVTLLSYPTSYFNLQF